MAALALVPTASNSTGHSPEPDTVDRFSSQGVQDLHSCFVEAARPANAASGLRR
jgi:hypothetical protein